MNRGIPSVSAWAVTAYPVLPLSLISLLVSVDEIQHYKRRRQRRSELSSCVNREAGLALIPYPILPPSLISLMVSVDVKYHKTITTKTEEKNTGDQSSGRSCMNSEASLGSQSLSHSSPAPNKPYGFCGRKAPYKNKNKIKTEKIQEIRDQAGAT